MLLAVDAGNTNVVFAVYDDEGRRGLWRASTDHARTADDYAVWLTSLMRMRDIVDEKGAYCGGVIAPGINLSLDALHRVSAQLPRIEVARPARVIGGGTVSAMQSGIYWGYVSLIEGLVERIRREFGVPMKVVATGGLAPLFAGGTDTIEHTDPDLTLSGIVEIWRRNRGAA